MEALENKYEVTISERYTYDVDYFGYYINFIGSEKIIPVATKALHGKNV